MTKNVDLLCRFQVKRKINCKGINGTNVMEIFSVGLVQKNIRLPAKMFFTNKLSTL